MQLIEETTDVAKVLVPNTEHAGWLSFYYREQQQWMSFMDNVIWLCKSEITQCCNWKWVLHKKQLLGLCFTTLHLCTSQERLGPRESYQQKPYLICLLDAQTRHLVNWTGEWRATPFSSVETTEPHVVLNSARICKLGAGGWLSPTQQRKCHFRAKCRGNGCTDADKQTRSNSVNCF